MQKYCLVKPMTVIMSIGKRPFDTEKDLILTNREIVICMERGHVFEILKSGCLKHLDFTNYTEVTEDTITDFSDLPVIKHETADTTKVVSDTVVLTTTAKQVEDAREVVTSDTLGIQQEILHIEPEQTPDTEEDDTKVDDVLVTEEDHTVTADLNAAEEVKVDDTVDTETDSDDTAGTVEPAKEETVEPVKETKKETTLKASNNNRKNK